MHSVAQNRWPVNGTGLHPGTILNPPGDSWPTDHGDYSGRRHSTLTQLTPQTVGSLSLVWAFRPTKESLSRLAAARKWCPRTPPYPTMCGRWMPALVARSGTTPINQTKGCILAIAESLCTKSGSIFMTPDAHLISLEAKNGNALQCRGGRHKKRILDHVAPLVVRNHVIVGVGGDFDNLAGYIRSFDPETGEARGNGTRRRRRERRTNHRRHDMDDQNLRSRSKSDLFGHRQSYSGVERQARPGDNLYTRSSR